MPRKQFHRSLPPLRAMHPRFRAFRPADNKTALLLKYLRDTITRVQEERAIPFYSMREVANFFGVALKTVVDIYERLEAEGLLTRLRGSHTLVQGKKLQPRHPIRGVVGFPVYLPALLIGNDWRDLMIHFEGELRRRHFVCDFIFYRAEEQFQGDLTERLLEHQLDIVYWHCPIPAHVPTMQRLLDGGIRLVVVSDGKGRFPREQYYLNLEHALEEGIRAWQAAGIQSATVLRSPRSLSAHANELMMATLKRTGLPHDTVTAQDAEIPGLVQRLTRRPHNGVIFVSHPWYESLCGKYTREMQRLFIGCRVFLTQGPPYHPSFQGRDVRVDTVSLPNEEIARRIARDVSTQRCDTTTRLATFHTRWLPRVNLGAVTRGL